MADLKISQLGNAATLDGTEDVEVVQGGVNVKTTTQDIADLGGGGGHVIEDEGTPVTQRANMNFTGAGVAVTDAGGKTVVTIPASISDTAYDATSWNAVTDIAPSKNAVRDRIEQAASETVTAMLEIATQAEVNTGTDDARSVTSLKLKNRDGDVATLTDSSTTDITSDKWTWATSSTTRTTTFSFTGDKSEGIITLSNTTCTITMPAACLCVSEGTPSGNNSLVIAGVSGDKYYVSIRKFGSAYYVVCKNFGQ